MHDTKQLTRLATVALAVTVTALAAWAGAPRAGRATIRPEAPRSVVADLTAVASRSSSRSRTPSAPSVPSGLYGSFSAGLVGISLKRAGIEYEYTAAAAGQPPLFVFKLEGYPVSMALLDPTDKGEEYRTATIRTGFTGVPKASLDAMNKWNSATRFAKGYLVKEGNVRLEMDLVFSGGVSPNNMLDQIGIYGSMVKGFVAAISDAPAAKAPEGAGKDDKKAPSTAGPADPAVPDATSKDDKK